MTLRGFNSHIPEPEVERFPEEAERRDYAETRTLRCRECEYVGDVECFEGEPEGCVVCGSTDFTAAT